VLVPASSAPSKSSVRFDNSADIYSGSAAASDISTTAVTMCCWYYRISSTTDPTLVGIQRSGPDQYFLLRLISTTTVPGMVDNSASVNGAPTWNPNSNEWAFAACTFSSGTGKIYAGRLMDATLNTTSSTGFTGPNTAASVRIGNDTFPEPFNGRIAGVKIWNAALSAAELELERWTYSPVRTADLWAWYPLDGTSTADASGNGHTLTAGGSLTTEAGPPYAS
jgi:hypothetical protein